LVVGLLASSAVSYVWLTLAAVVAAWAVAVLLLRFGDRGTATGIGLAASLGATIAVGLVVMQWITVGWPLW
jgi:hypothetical protein